MSIVSLGCLHPIAKVQSAALHFFLDEEEEIPSDEEDEGPDMRSLQHKRTVNKKTRSGDKKLEKSMKEAKKVFSSPKHSLLYYAKYPIESKEEEQ